MLLLHADGLAGVVDGLDDDGALALAFFAQADAAGDLGHDGGLARPACLEDFRDARQTAGDVLRAADFARRLGQQRPGRDHLVGTHFQVGLFRNVVHFQALAAFVLDDDLRMQIALVLHDDPAFGLSVDVVFLAQRFALDDVLEANAAAALGQDRDAVRVPVAQHLCPA